LKLGAIVPLWKWGIKGDFVNVDMTEGLVMTDG
jgi:hypothetical protein